MLAVSDGHGSAPYFRSEIGAELAITSLIELLTENIDKMATCYFDSEFNQIEKGLSVGIANNRWPGKIAEHLLENPITEEECAFLSNDEFGEGCQCVEIYRKALNDFINCKEDRLKFIRGSVLKQIYGCTLIAYIETEHFWYALQIGDGDLAISNDGLNFQKPIAEDPRCIGTETTSLCEDKSYSCFRFAHGQGKPKMVFCSSDGISNSVNGDENLFNLYQFFFTRFFDFEFDNCKCCRKNDCEEDFFCDFDCRIRLTKDKIFDELPNISDKGSGDDVSLAGKILFGPTDIKKIAKYTYYRQAKKIQLANHTKAKEYFCIAAKLENPEIVYEIATNQLRVFCDDLTIKKQCIEKDKLELIKTISKVRNQTKEKKLLDDLYISLSNYYISELRQQHECDFALIDEICNYKNTSNNAILSKCVISLRSSANCFMKNTMIKELEFNNKDFIKILDYSDCESAEYDFLFEFVKKQLEKDIVQQDAISLIYNYLFDLRIEKNNEKKLFELNILLLKFFVKTKKEICCCISYFDVDECPIGYEREFGKALYLLYEFYEKDETDKAMSYLVRGAKKYENVNCIYALAENSYKEAERLFSLEKLCEAKFFFKMQKLLLSELVIQKMILK